MKKNPGPNNNDDVINTMTMNKRPDLSEQILIKIDNNQDYQYDNILLLLLLIIWSSFDKQQYIIFAM